jgi:hypothetical protein
MKKLLDPIANAKTIAFLIILSGVFGLLRYPPKLLDSAIYDQPIPIVFGFLSSLASIIVGLGLRKVKLWGLYAFIALTGANLLYMVFYLSQGYPLGKAVVVVNIIFVVLAIWFFSAKDRFKR